MSGQKQWHLPFPSLPVPSRPSERASERGRGNNAVLVLVERITRQAAQPVYRFAAASIIHVAAKGKPLMLIRTIAARSLPVFINGTPTSPLFGRESMQLNSIEYRANLSAMAEEAALSFMYLRLRRPNGGRFIPSLIYRTWDGGTSFGILGNLYRYLWGSLGVRYDRDIRSPAKHRECGSQRASKRLDWIML
ncbi:hypothetical protein DL98DRAFT_526239 [Cadophora sp. DSE1049]|nr:hypothetical protein DL98DRAFT_526239 [Cadophora sp. DSE1049]